jgi:hypothetical protein
MLFTISDITKETRQVFMAWIVPVPYDLKQLITAGTNLMHFSCNSLIAGNKKASFR